jgi:hypothetical protein
MPNHEIEEFAKNLVQEVRDLTIRECDRSLHPNANHAIAKRWSDAARAGNGEYFARVLIPDIVDSVLTHFCRAIDEGHLRLSYTASNGKVANLTVDGLAELAGWYIGSDGWRAKYSKERFADDFSDLK